MEECESDISTSEYNAEDYVGCIDDVTSSQCEDIFDTSEVSFNIQDQDVNESEVNISIRSCEHKPLGAFEYNVQVDDVEPSTLNSDIDKTDENVPDSNVRIDDVSDSNVRVDDDSDSNVKTDDVSDSNVIDDDVTVSDTKPDQDIHDEAGDQNEYSGYVPCSEYVLRDEDDLFRLCRVSWPVDDNQNYVRGCEWSPDGTCFLSVVRGDGMHIMELPSDLYSKTQISKDRSNSDLKSAVRVGENGLVYDTCWFPGMRSTDPATCCWAATCQHGPVQLWDAFTGALRCSYRGYNLVDEVEAAISVDFSFDGQQLYCGYRKALRTFHVDRPGRDFTLYKMNNSVSCITSSRAQPGLVAIGSWQKTIEFVDDKDGTLRTLTKITGHNGGITHLKFSIDGLCLYSGARKNNEIVCWDLRNPGKPLFCLERCSDTNQRIDLDLSLCSKWIFSGGLDGVLKIWNVKEDCRPDHCFEYRLHSDCINSVSVHPYLPILITGTGQHHYFSIFEDEDIETLKKVDNSVSMWWLGGFDES